MNSTDEIHLLQIDAKKYYSESSWASFSDKEKHNITNRLSSAYKTMIKSLRERSVSDELRLYS